LNLARVEGEGALRAFVQARLDLDDAELTRQVLADLGPYLQRP
jgi:hypothetical protein